MKYACGCEYGCGVVCADSTKRGVCAAVHGVCADREEITPQELTEIVMGVVSYVVGGDASPDVPIDEKSRAFRGGYLAAMVGTEDGVDLETEGGMRQCLEAAAYLLCSPTWGRP